MNKFVILPVVILILSISSNMVCAGEQLENNIKTTWQDIFSSVVGHYPVRSDEVVENKAGFNDRLNVPKNWEFDLGMQRFLLSHTSYEIGNPDEPFQKPLSRLEFPISTWWLDFRLRRTCPRWSIGGRAGFEVASNTDGRMKDSDWENPNNTDMLTTYSESAGRLEQGYHFRADVDVNVSDWLRLPKGFEIRPLFAFQFQRLVVMAHDGVQWSVGDYSEEDDDMDLDGASSATALPGNSIRFRQDWYLYQIGVRGRYTRDLTKNIAIAAYGEADWGPAVGFNEDHHLLRPDLFGYITSSGYSMYFTTGLDVFIKKTIKIGIIMDYLGISTKGETRHYNAPMGENFKWDDGVRAWSDQTSIIARVSYDF